jgi:hypothetical protein
MSRFVGERGELAVRPMVAGTTRARKAKRERRNLAENTERQPINQ